MDHDIGFCDHLYTDTVLIAPFPAVWKRDGNLDRPLFRREVVVHAGKQAVHVRNFRKKTGNFHASSVRSAANKTLGSLRPDMISPWI